ncbi:MULTISPECIES: Flp family type IVb pilin [Cupriavidus]|uniref:Flp family type IVb pilin n=1 Tax=Cupriavidus TaxID=106589 RepID=UPI0002A2EDA4|nr:MULTISPECIES: Flp family type IVb pilin [Cupriavidus]EKZ98210.1 Flp/Fap pilin component [Cupriavidus sp. HMR-1]
MRQVKASLFRKAQRGATAIEYGLIAGLIAVAIVAGVTDLGKNLGTGFSNLATKVTTWFAAVGP